MTDPKQHAASKKAPLHLIPPALNEAMAFALSAGAKKYGAWNWRRGARISAMTYVGAIRRHLDAWMDGEDLDKETNECHLAHIAASCAILLDSAKHGTFIDNRPNAQRKET